MEWWGNSYQFASPSQLWTFSAITTALWLDTSDESTMTIVSGACSELRDKSGNIRHAAQATSSSRPTVLTSFLNGRTALDFNGTSSEMSIANVGLLRSPNQTLVVAAVRDNAVGRNEIPFAISDPGIGDGFVDIPRWSDNNTYSQVGYASNRPVALSAVSNSFYVNVITGGAVQQIYTNGSLVATGSTQSTANFVGGTIIGSFGSGRAVSPSIRFFDGKVLQSVLIPQVVDNNLRQIFEGYLAHFYGSAASLPANHPYKNAPPYL